jgi:hypothetical protein
MSRGSSGGIYCVIGTKVDKFTMSRFTEYEIGKTEIKSFGLDNQELTSLPDLLLKAKMNGNMTVQTTEIGLRFTGRDGIYFVELCKTCAGPKHEVFDLRAWPVTSREQITY